MSKLRTYISVYRKEKNMQQDELAELVGVRRETISRLEKGLYNPSLKLAYDIAKVFGVTIEKLFEFYEEDNLESK
ncbi:helix-turn-helix transcriptional regulator [Clostridium cylindrosporum]|uniref:DNA-binding helix-turn-helix protein n=1 Tax=Clostridium cylindrosporum DSM 605 TaxID=1121307 RepID=A0A0J8G1F7_CLOCY|nr:helix-turn-helix transcriptional regulator [Clostridium cylindrosporum]KMT21591.1 DNA-binding helix-turn-helix protein [Clostridium cylindrosporum DSM 605]